MSQLCERFYVTHCPPGRARGADDWGTYISQSRAGPPWPEELSDPNYDEDGDPRPLDWFFNDN